MIKRWHAPRRRIAALALATGAATFMPAANSAADIPHAAYAPINRALLQTHILPRYKAFADATGRFDDAARRYCAAPAVARPAEVRMRFGEALSAWMGVQHLRFGPSELLLRANRIHFWPEARGKIGRAVKSMIDTPPSQPLRADRFPRLSAAVQGLPAAEYLLYEASAREEKRRNAACALLVGVTANLKRMAAAINADWRGGKVNFTRTLTVPGRANAYFKTHQEATVALFRSLHDGLQLIADAKLRPVLGASIEAARPNFAESHRSGRSQINIVENLIALRAIYEGEGTPGLGDLLRTHGKDPKLERLMRRAFALTLENAKGIDAPLKRAVKDPALRPRVEKLLLQVRALRQIVRTRLAERLDLAVGFNSLDGD